MNPLHIRELLEGVHKGGVPVEAALEELKRLPYQDIGYATIDHHRSLRQGFPEVIYGESKAPHEIVGITQRIRERQQPVLITRVKPDAMTALQDAFPEGTPYTRSNLFTVGEDDIEPGVGDVLVVCAGTSDLPVAEEAAITVRMTGSNVEQISDVGVAGIHRLFGHLERIRKANVIVVVAGMEGALAGVVGGLVDCPVVAVPTSVGYGANFGGVSALLTMLNSCATGVTVVNIDNGFGGGFAASTINKRICGGPASLQETGACSTHEG